MHGKRFDGRQIDQITGDNERDTAKMFKKQPQEPASPRGWTYRRSQRSKCPSAHLRSDAQNSSQLSFLSAALPEKAPASLRPKARAGEAAGASSTCAERTGLVGNLAERSDEAPESLN